MINAWRYMYFCAYLSNLSGMLGLGIYANFFSILKIPFIINILTPYMQILKK